MTRNKHKDCSAGNSTEARKPPITLNGTLTLAFGLPALGIPLVMHRLGLASEKTIVDASVVIFAFIALIQTGRFLLHVMAAGYFVDKTPTRSSLTDLRRTVKLEALVVAISIAIPLMRIFTPRPILFAASGTLLLAGSFFVATSYSMVLKRLADEGIHFQTGWAVLMASAPVKKLIERFAISHRNEEAGDEFRAKADAMAKADRPLSPTTHFVQRVLAGCVGALVLIPLMNRTTEATKPPAPTPTPTVTVTATATVTASPASSMPAAVPSPTAQPQAPVAPTATATVAASPSMTASATTESPPTATASPEASNRPTSTATATTTTAPEPTGTTTTDPSTDESPQVWAALPQQ